MYRLLPWEFADSIGKRKDPHSVRADRVAVSLAALFLLASCADTVKEQDPRQWLAGDHHIHSRYSVGWDREQEPPAPIIGGDAIYPIPMNALMGRHHGLDWMAATDHGGPNHAKVNLERAYPEIQLSRSVVPEVIQFFALELNSPGADHSSLIIPHTHDEAEVLYDLEARFDRHDAFPPDPGRNTEARMLEALRAMKELPRKPLVIAHHPSRSAEGPGQYGLYEPRELRDWNDTAPEVAVGMEGAPGHQALALERDGSVSRHRPRGGYGRHPTMGGFDQMTARLGGLWDALLGEGRRWWITANSDSHVHYTEGGADFWPGEYSKTWVWAEKNHDSIMEGIRSGRIFVSTGDLVSRLDVHASSGAQRVMIGQTITVSRGVDVDVSIRFIDPETPNHRGENPAVRRVDLIVGEVRGPAADRSSDTNPTTRVVQRFTRADWRRVGSSREMHHRLENVQGDLYLRVRGTNGAEAEPGPDSLDEDPWSDLWFYSNPIFVETD
jgi:hypothetical protein